jgi:hypothetical protein
MLSYRAIVVLCSVHDPVPREHFALHKAGWRSALPRRPSLSGIPRPLHEPSALKPPASASISCRSLSLITDNAAGLARVPDARQSPPNPESLDRDDGTEKPT